MTRAEEIARELTKAERLFVLAKAGTAPVPDAVWFGRHCDLIEQAGPTTRRKSALCKEVARIILPSTDVNLFPKSVRAGVRAMFHED